MPWDGRSDLPNFARLPSKKFRLGPADAFSERTMQTWSAYHRSPRHRNWFAQLAYQTVVYGPITPITEGPANGYRIDVNKLLPNGQANPNVGKAYAEVSQSKQYQENYQQDIRLLTTYKFDAPRLFDLKQRFSLISGFRFDRFELTQSAIRWLNNPAQANPTNAVNRINYRIYWDNPLPSITSKLPVMPGAIFGEVDITTPTYSQRQLYYSQLASTTTFFHDRLSIIAGLRHDDLEFDSIQNIGQDPVTGKFVVGLNNPATHLISLTKANTSNVGSVFYILPWLGLNANYSTNFAPAGLRRQPDHR